MQIRLNKYLSQAGICSRREADEHILAGEVKINGEVAALGNKVDSDKDKIELKGVPINTEKPALIYYALYKPKGIISAAKNEQEKTVVDLVPSEPRVYPVGRLDKNSEGLMILTNDGELTNALTHPSYKHEKEYEVIVRIMNQELRSKDTSEIATMIKNRVVSGVTIDGKTMKADEARVSMIHNSKFVILMTIHTGYNRQIRKMCAKIGLEIQSLKRVRIGKLKQEMLGLKPSEYKEIGIKDIL